MPIIKAIIPCESQEVVQNYLDMTIDLDSITARTIVAYPDGVEKRVTTLHKLRDYFDAIENEVDGTTFKLVFHVKSERPTHNPSYWKDLIIKIVQSLTNKKVFPKLEKG